ERRRPGRGGRGRPARAFRPRARRLRAPPGIRARPRAAHRARLPGRRRRPARAPASARPRRRRHHRPARPPQLAGQAAHDGRRPFQRCAPGDRRARVHRLADPHGPRPGRRRGDPSLAEEGSVVATGAPRGRGQRPHPGRRRARRRRQPHRDPRRRHAGAAVRHGDPGRRAGRPRRRRPRPRAPCRSGARQGPQGADRALRAAGGCRARALAGAGSGAAAGRGGGGCALPGCTRAPDRPAHGARAGAPPHRRGARRSRHRPPRPAPHRGHPPAGGRRGPAVGAGAPGPCVPGHHAALHAREHRAPALGVPAGAPPRL
ncbi:MAG: Site-specific tyrosine recombinase XerC, partial [uncultured Nocardioides sp.]